MKQKELSNWLKAIIIMLALCCIVLAALIVPEQGSEFIEGHPEYADLFLPCLICIELTFLPVFIALLKAWGIAADIGRDMSFSLANALRLRSISRLALLDTMAYITGALFLLIIDRIYMDFLFVAMSVAFMGVCFTVACAALSHLTRKAADMKAENDLTV